MARNACQREEEERAREDPVDVSDKPDLAQSAYWGVVAELCGCGRKAKVGGLGKVRDGGDTKDHDRQVVEEAVTAQCKGPCYEDEVDEGKDRKDCPEPAGAVVRQVRLGRAGGVDVYAVGADV